MRLFSSRLGASAAALLAFGGGQRAAAPRDGGQRTPGAGVGAGPVAAPPVGQRPASERELVLAHVLGDGTEHELKGDVLAFVVDGDGPGQQAGGLQVA